MVNPTTSVTIGAQYIRTPTSIRRFAQGQIPWITQYTRRTKQKATIDCQAKGSKARRSHVRRSPA